MVEAGRMGMEPVDGHSGSVPSWYGLVVPHVIRVTPIALSGNIERSTATALDA